MGTRWGWGLPWWVVVPVVLLDLAIRVVAIGFVPERRRPSSGMAWLLLILFLPLVGALVFLLLGSTFVDRRRRDQQARAVQTVRTQVRQPELEVRRSWPTWLAGAVDLNHELGGLGVVGGNRTELSSDYATSIVTAAELVRGAERYVHVQYYILGWDSSTDAFFTAMVEAAGRGVKVRVLFDHLACFRIDGYREMLARLEAGGVEVHAELPLQPLKGRWRRPDLRNHRKIVVVDGLRGMTGSQNLIDASYHNKKHERAGRRWHDLTVRLDGPVAHSLDLLFATDWFLETGEVLRAELESGRHDEDSIRPGAVCQVVPSGPGFPNENNLRLFNSLIYGAQRRLSITSPYFVPDESLLYAITTAAQRGVAVELFVSAEADQFMVDHAQKSYYTALLELGVRIFAYPAPAVLHSKHFSIDDDVAVVGSSNMDIRSFNLDFEVSVLFIDTDVVTGLRAVEDGYRAVCTEITLETWRQRPLRQRYLDNVLRLTSAIQ